MSNVFGIKRITQHYNLALFLSSGLLTLSTFNFAFDNQGFAQTQAMNQFLERFGDYNAKTKAYAFPTWFTSVFNSVIFVGQGLGIMVGSMISARFGRRWCVFVMSLWSMLAAIVVLTSKSRYQVLAGRIIEQGYIGMEVASIPIFQSEIMPKEVRGVAVGSYQMSIAFGGLIINIICRGTSTIQSDAAWRIPFGLFFIIPAIEASAIFFIPESPRWLLSKGRMEEARRSLTRIRVNQDPIAIEAEIEATLLALEAEKDKGSYGDLFRGNNLRRTVITWIVFFYIQGTGEAFASRYATIYVKQLKTVNPFTVSCITFTGNFLAAVLVLYLTDATGRRPILMSSAVIQTIALTTIGALGATGLNANQKAGIVAMITLYAVSNQGLYAPILWIVCGELPEQRLRDKTQRIGGVIAVIVNFAVSFTLPYLTDPGYANLGMKFAFIYAPICLSSVFFVYFFVPECKGRDLEEIDLLFALKISARQSVNWRPDNLTAELAQIAHGDNKPQDDKIEGDRDLSRQEV